MTEISIHALLAESDTRRTYHKDESQEFLSTLSLRRATGILAISLRIVFAEFLSTLSLRRATAFSFALLYSTTISIHALLAESDCLWDLTGGLSYDNFYPRSPCGERLQWGGMKSLSEVISIHALLAESDSWYACSMAHTANFYPRSPCGERHLRVLDGSKSSIISIHALLAESDMWLLFPAIMLIDFYPRSPCGERPPRCGR